MTTARLSVRLAAVLALVMLLGVLLGASLASAHTDNSVKKQPGWWNYDTQHVGWCDGSDCDFRSRLRLYTSNNFKVSSAQYYRYWDGSSDDDLVFGLTFLSDDNGEEWLWDRQTQCKPIDGANYTAYVSWSHDGHDPDDYGTDKQTQVWLSCPSAAFSGFHRLALEKAH